MSAINWRLNLPALAEVGGIGGSERRDWHDRITLISVIDDSARHAGVERRPVEARNLRVFRRLASTMARWGISPNAISVASMVCAGGAAILLAVTDGVALRERVFFAVAAGLIQLRLIANLLDGLVAVEGGRASPTGELFNEVPDRVSDVVVFAGAGYATASSATLGWTAALLALFVAYVRVFGRSQGFPGDYRGPMAKQQRMFVITVVCVVMAVLPTAWLPRLPAMDGGVERGPMWIGLSIVTTGCVVTAALRLGRIISLMNASGRET